MNYLLLLILLLASCSLKNNEQTDSSTITTKLFTQKTFDICHKVNKLFIAQNLNTDSVYIGYGECYESNKTISVYNFSMSPFSIPNTSIKTSHDNKTKLIYFYDKNNKFYIGLLGFNQKLFLYSVDLRENKMYNTNIHTLNYLFYIDELSNTLITSSNLEDLDTVFQLRINKYNLSNLTKIEVKEIKIQIADFDKFRKTSPLTELN